MMPATNATSQTCCEKTRACLSSEKTVGAVKCTAILGGLVGSFWIPVAPLAVGSMALSGFLGVKKAFDYSSYKAALGERSWKQVLVGSAICSGGAATAVAVGGTIGVLIGIEAVFLGGWATYSNELPYLCNWMVPYCKYGDTQEPHA